MCITLSELHGERRGGPKFRPIIMRAYEHDERGQGHVEKPKGNTVLTTLARRRKQTQQLPSLDCSFMCSPPAWVSLQTVGREVGTKVREHQDANHRIHHEFGRGIEDSGEFAGATPLCIFSMRRRRRSLAVPHRFTEGRQQLQHNHDIHIGFSFSNQK